MKRITVIGLICYALFCTQNALCQESVGKMGDIKPTDKTGTAVVTRQAGATGTASSIAKKDSVLTQDIIQLGENTLASVTFDDGGYVKMRDGTRMEILSIDEIFLMDGHLFVNTKWHAKKGRRFQIKTKKVIAGTIGTEFYIFHSEACDSTVLAVFKGAVKLESADPSVVVQGTPLVVTAGQAVTVIQNSVTSFPQPSFNQIKSQAKSWHGAMGPKGFPVWGVVVPAVAVTGATAGLLLSSPERTEENTTASGTITVQIPPGN
ncbi:hypothetical protein EH223_10280 [candidate division KSB1 bacterium]|nr:FecR domain-containing protein [candidate division KSB1 bacterium]RQW03301.1 MAG: hypothetical protein EH223_10280 [candidate division KSB1 bacterium]